MTIKRFAFCSLIRSSHAVSEHSAAPGGIWNFEQDKIFRVHGNVNTPVIIFIH